VRERDRADKLMAELLKARPWWGMASCAAPDSEVFWA
jgi:hypothetical protein